MLYYQIEKWSKIIESKKKQPIKTWKIIPKIIYKWKCNKRK